MAGPLLRYRAGPRALEQIRRDGLRPGMVSALVGPASGPRWLILEALDRVLLGAGILGSSRAGRTLLAGSSAGAWRMMALASRDPLEAHRRLLDAYVSQVFPPSVAPEVVSDAYRTLLHNLFVDELDHLLSHPTFDLAVHTSRLRRGRSKSAFVASFVAAAVFNPLISRSTDLFFERVLFHSRPEAIISPFTGRVVPLSRDNLIDAVLASGTVPIYLRPVGDPVGGPRGHYFDGGLLDYHLRQCWSGASGDLVLFPHYQERILPRWLDRFLPWHRRPATQALDDLLQIYPTSEFLAGLPEGQAPDREDFTRFAHRPEERLRRWRESIRQAEALGEELREDLAMGRVGERVQLIS